MSPAKLCCSFVAAVLCISLTPHAGGVVNGIPVRCNDRRFDCVGMFFTADMTPGACGGGVSGTCVLIAPDQILIKRHQLNLNPAQSLSAIGANRFRARFQRTPTGDSVNTFWYNNTGCHGIYQEVLITALVDPPIPGSDTVLAYLEHPIVNIRPASLDLTTPLPTGTHIYLVGWGYAGECFATGDHWTLRYAKGKLPYGATGDSFWYTPCGLGSVAPCLSCPAGGPWVAGNLHDSGAGIFIEAPSAEPGVALTELRLIGTVSTTGTAQRPSAFNNAGGLPKLVSTPPISQGMISDFNRDGSIDVGDLFAYFTSFMAGGCEANVSLSGQTNLSDLFQFLSAYFAKQ